MNYATCEQCGNISTKCTCNARSHTACGCIRPNGMKCNLVATIHFKHSNELYSYSCEECHERNRPKSNSDFAVEKKMLELREYFDLENVPKESWPDLCRKYIKTKCGIDMDEILSKANQRKRSYNQEGKM